MEIGKSEIVKLIQLFLVLIAFGFLKEPVIDFIEQSLPFSTAWIGLALLVVVVVLFKVE